MIHTHLGRTTGLLLALVAPFLLCEGATAQVEIERYPVGTPAPPAKERSEPSGSYGPVNVAGQATPDHTRWTFWWEFNKEPHLGLKYHVHDGGVDPSGGGILSRDFRTLRPSQEQLYMEIVPALRRTLEETGSVDVITGCLMALAKIADPPFCDDAGFRLLFERTVADPRDEVSESAVLALGILGDDLGVGILGELLRDGREGRRRAARAEVPLRTRAFAAYALGLIGARTSEEDVRLEILHLLAYTLGSGFTPSCDLDVACVIAYGLVPLETVFPSRARPRNAFGPDCRLAQLDYLLALHTDAAAPAIVRGHAATALARLHDFFPAEHCEEHRARIAWTLLSSLEHQPRHDAIVRSTVLALGTIGDADTDTVDREIRGRLYSLARNAADLQTRHYALMALARIGGDPWSDASDGPEAREIAAVLADRLAHGDATTRRWAALAIGEMGHRLGERRSRLGDREGRRLDDRRLRLAEEMWLFLRERLHDEPRESTLGAMAIGAGLLRDSGASRVLLERLAGVRDTDTRGYIALGLGLARADAIEPLRKIVAKSKYRPQLLRQASVGLALLGDKQLVPLLLDMLADAKGLATQAALMATLGFVGDARCVTALVGMLENTEITDSARGFAAVALGIVGDKQVEHWNAPLSDWLDYLDAPPSHTHPDGNGIFNSQ